MYFALREGLVSKPRLILVGEDPLKYITNNDKDYYVSLYQYNEQHRQRIEQTGTVAGIKDTTTNRLYFDFDSKENLAAAQNDTKFLVKRLLNKGFKLENIGLFFSGSKGFSVELSLTDTLNPDQFKSIVHSLAGDLKTLDLKVSDPNRIVRVPFTKHQESGLYKIPLQLHQLENLNTDAIKTLAKTAVKTFVKQLPVKLPFELPKVAEKQQKIVVTNNIDLSKRPQGWKPCKWSLLQGNFEPGNRHEALVILAATCRGLGFDQETTFHMCLSAAEKQVVLFKQDVFSEDELRHNIIEKSVFSETWNGGQYSCTTHPWLKTYCQSLDTPCKSEDDDKNYSVQKISDIENQFKDFVVNIEKNTIKTGLKELDLRLPLTIGQNLGVVGSASSGKTALALEILKNTSKLGVVSVFASLDMHRNRLFEKLLYKVSNGKPRNEIYQMFKDNKYKSLIDDINKDYGNVFFYDRSCPTVSDIRKYIEKVNSENPNKVKLVMLDYFERVNSERSDDTAASKDISGQLQDLVNDYNICLITLVQPNKFSLGGGPDSPILSYTAIKGSSFLYQSFRSIISIWRPFFNPQTQDKDKYMQMAILKNDLGELSTIDYVFEGKTGTIREFASPEEREQLYTWLKEKEDEKNGKDKVNNWE